MTDMPADLEDLAVSVRKSLHWAVFLLGAMVLVLVVDLQIKRSIARQAVTLAVVMNRAATDRLVTDVKGGNGERSGTVDAPADDGDHPGRGGRGDVDGGPRIPAGDGEAGGPVPAKAPRRRAGTRVRPPGDGG